MQNPGDTGQHRRDDNRDQFVAQGVVSQRTGAFLILADRHEDRPDRRTDQPFDQPESENEQRQPDVIQVEPVLRRVDEQRQVAQCEAVFAIGQAQTPEVDPRHFSHGQREDREVHAAQPQGHQAGQQADDTGDDQHQQHAESEGQHRVQPAELKHDPDQIATQSEEHGMAE